MTVLCIDDSKKPAKIPPHEWIKKGNEYTVIEIVNMGIQNGIVGFKLEEVALSASSFPYEYYSSNRFKIVEEDKSDMEIAEEVVEPLEI